MSNELVLEGSDWRLQEAASGPASAATSIGVNSVKANRLCSIAGQPIKAVAARNEPPFLDSNIRKIGNASLVLDTGGAGGAGYVKPASYLSAGRTPKANDLNFSYASSWSVSFWYVMASTNSTLIFMGTWGIDPTSSDTNAKRGWGVYLSSSAARKLAVIIGAQGGLIGTHYVGTRTTSDIPFNSWTHVVVRRNGTSAPATPSYTDVTIHLNGVSQSTASHFGGSPLTDGSEQFNSGQVQLEIGAWRTGLNTTGHLRRMDEVGIWNRFITDAEIATLYNSGSGATCDNVSSGLIHRYSMDLPTAGPMTVEDLAGNINITGTT